MTIKSSKEAIKDLEKWNKETADYLKKKGYESAKNLREWTSQTRKYLKGGKKR